METCSFCLSPICADNRVFRGEDITNDPSSDLVLCSSCMKKEYPLSYIALEYRVEKLPWNGRYPRCSIYQVSTDGEPVLVGLMNMN